MAGFFEGSVTVTDLLYVNAEIVVKGKPVFYWLNHLLDAVKRFEDELAKRP